MEIKLKCNIHDITEVWKHSHNHLQPLDQKQSFINCQLECCILCGKHHAISIKANLKFGSNWYDNQTVLYCYACQRYSFPEIEKIVAIENNIVLTAIDARLWFRTPMNNHLLK